MMLFYGLAQPGAQYMGVDLCRADIGMPEHRLYAAQVRAALQQMRSETVP